MPSPEKCDPVSETTNAVLARIPSLVIRDVWLGDAGSIRLRRLNGLGEIEWVEIADDANTVELEPADRLVLEGNAFCVVYLFVDGQTEEAVAQLESVRVQPEAPVWAPRGNPGPSPSDFRFVAFQNPPAIEVRDLTVDGVVVQEVFVKGGMFQIEA